MKNSRDCILILKPPQSLNQNEYDHVYCFQNKEAKELELYIYNVLSKNVREQKAIDKSIMQHKHIMTYA